MSEIDTRRGRMRRRAARALVLLAAVATAGASGADPAPPAVLDLVLPEGRTTRPLDALAAGMTLAEGDAVRVTDLGRDAHTSHQLVALRDGETPHRHARHDLLVVLLRGHGEMTVGETGRPAGRGSIFYVPRGVAHAFRNASPEPAVAYVVYLPPLEGEDRVGAD